MNNKLLYKSTDSEYKKNKSIDNQSDSCYFIMVNSAKNILIKRTVSLVTTQQEKY